MKIKLDFIAMLFSLTESLMVGLPSDLYRLIGFNLFLTSNILWFIFCRNKPEWKSVMYLNFFYTITSIMGICNNF